MESEINTERVESRVGTKRCQHEQEDDGPAGFLLKAVRHLHIHSNSTKYYTGTMKKMVTHHEYNSYRYVLDIYTEHSPSSR